MSSIPGQFPPAGFSFKFLTIREKLLEAMKSPDPDRALKEYFVDFISRNPKRLDTFRKRVKLYCGEKHQETLEKLIALL